MASAGSLLVHEARAHGEGAHAEQAVEREAVQYRPAAPARRSGAGRVLAVLATGAMIVGLLVFVVGTRSDPSAPAPAASAAPAADPALAAARDQYLDFARTANAEHDAVMGEIMTAYARQAVEPLRNGLRHYAAVMRAEDGRLGAISFPVAVRPLADRVIAVDAEMIAVLERAAQARSCPAMCLGLQELEAHFPDRVAATANLRQALGLDPDPDA